MNDVFTYYKITYPENIHKGTRYYVYKNGLLIKRIAVKQSKTEINDLAGAGGLHKESRILANLEKNHVRFGECLLKVNKLTEDEWTKETFIVLLSN